MAGGWSCKNICYLSFRKLLLNFGKYLMSVKFLEKYIFLIHPTLGSDKREQKLIVSSEGEDVADLPRGGHGRADTLCAAQSASS